MVPQTQLPFKVEVWQVICSGLGEQRQVRVFRDIPPITDTQAAITSGQYTPTFGMNETYWWLPP